MVEQSGQVSVDGRRERSDTTGGSPPFHNKSLVSVMNDVSGECQSHIIDFLLNSLIRLFLPMVLSGSRLFFDY